MLQKVNYMEPGCIPTQYPWLRNLMTNILRVPPSEKIEKVSDPATGRRRMVRPEQKPVDLMKDLARQY